MNTIPDHVGREAVRLLNEECRGIYAWPRDADSPSIITVAKLLMNPPAPMIDPDEEAAKRVLVEFYGGPSFAATRIVQSSLARATEQMRKEREAWEAGRC